MIREEKKSKIRELVKDMLIQSNQEMIKKIDDLLNSGAIDIESWDESDKPMILPKCIVTAILKRESNQYMCKGTSYEKQIKKEVSNLEYFI